MTRAVLAKIGYGATFVILLPALLVLWAHVAGPFDGLPVVRSALYGCIAAAVGVAMMGLGMAALFVYGGGLPMNAFPPPRYVTQSVYALTRHPIYVGFCIAVVGVSVAVGSSTGLWLISPSVMLACVALVMGYEGRDLRRRFGDSLHQPWISLAADDSATPGVREWISAVVLVLATWLIVYEAVASLGVAKDAITAYLPFEQKWPVWEPAEIFYAGDYVLVFLAVFFAPTRRDLRNLSISAWAAIAICAVVWITFPVVAEPRRFAATSLLGHFLKFERGYDTPANAFPSFHVIWAMLAAHALTPRGRAWAVSTWTSALLVSVSTVMTGMHSLADVVGGVVVYFIVTRLNVIALMLQSAAERLANSWQEWRIGPIRIINHGFYAGLSACIGVLIITRIAGPGALSAIVMTAVISVVAGGLWGQFVEGSPRLLRPFGYYGSIAGTVLGIAVAPSLGTSAWLLAGAFSVAGPWIQALGRLRCFVQGCCHGHATSSWVGIRYEHPRTRVCRIADLTGVPIHPTQLYSILANILIGMLLYRLWTLHAPLAVVCGLYLFLSGIARFIEESYRGEPQTRLIGRLPVYQWLSIAFIVVGAALTALHTATAPPSPHPLSPASLAMAAAMGLFTTAAMGVDLPESNRRFSRLA